MTTLYSASGRALDIGKQIGAGGEGTVHLVPSNSAHVAKVYRSPVGRDYAEKLAAMVVLHTNILASFTAWPIDTLRLQPGGSTVGFLMPRVSDHKQIHKLYGPKSRQIEFSSADWRFLVQTARNLAMAFHSVHERGVVIGDVNHDNILVSSRATVYLIDCDSFQVKSGTKVYPCNVGVATHQPPELQGISSFRGVERTSNHDNFGLAVMIFQLLFLARHPFSGRFLGRGDMPLERAIEEYRFAYGRGASGRGMASPPNSPPIEAVTAEIATAFERAFAQSGSRDGGRPSASEWVRLLERLSVQLGQCTSNPSHWFYRNLSSCPWCAIQAVTGTVLYAVAVARSAPGSGAPFDLVLVWSQIIAVTSPGSAPQIESHPGTVPPTPEFQAAGQAQRRRTRRLSIVTLVVWILGIPFIAASPILAVLLLAVTLIAGLCAPAFGWRAWLAAVQQSRRSGSEWRAIYQGWLVQAGDSEFTRIRHELEQIKHQYDGLSAERQMRLQKLRAEARDRQFVRHLQQHRIEVAPIKGVGPAKKSTLQSFGVETAADVTTQRISALPGFGPVLTQAMLQWRATVERSFVFDQGKALDPADVRSIEDAISQQQRTLEPKLASGRARLEQAREQALKRRQTLKSEIISAQFRVAQARSNLRAMWHP